MGGKNAIIVLDDADLELALSETAISICASTGQRCSCASRLFVHESLVDSFSERLMTLLRGVKIGMPLDEDVFMGPLASMRGFVKLQELCTDEALGSLGGCMGGCSGERLLRVDPGLPPPFVGPGLVRYPSTEQRSLYQREEIFGPEAAIHPIRDLDEGIAATNDSDYGLVASVFTRDPVRYRHAIGRIRTGLLNWNKGTIGASGKLPFGGLGKSGNDRPAGVSASLYCTVPQAHLESGGEAAFDPGTLPPGMPRP
jgi:succinylglutamic semialdehyde dehydrogenase